MTKSVRVVLIGLLVVAGCSDGPGEPDVGALRVVVTSTGTVDLNGYTVAIGAASPVPIASDGEQVSPP